MVDPIPAVDSLSVQLITAIDVLTEFVETRDTTWQEWEGGRDPIWKTLSVEDRAMIVKLDGVVSGLAAQLRLTIPEKPIDDPRDQYNRGYTIYLGLTGVPVYYWETDDPAVRLNQRWREVVQGLKSAARVFDQFDGEDEVVRFENEREITPEYRFDGREGALPLTPANIERQDVYGLPRQYVATQWRKRKWLTDRKEYEMGHVYNFREIAGLAEKWRREKARCKT